MPYGIWRPYNLCEIAESIDVILAKKPIPFDGELASLLVFIK